jgi:GT2 family glycosyltransferase
MCGQEDRVPSVTVIICAYTQARWPLLLASVASVEAQTCAPAEIIVCIDHNDELLRQCEEHFLGDRSTGSVPLRVVPNKYNGHLGSARNTASEIAFGDVLAFLDDDAAAAPDWLEQLMAVYDEPTVGAVGGAPLPVYERARPRWFPREFDWVYGCAYEGLPRERAPVAHLIGANMSVRRRVLAEISGFHSDDHDDMDMCHRVAYAGYKVIYEPRAVVHHFVPGARTAWRYFWRRCYWVNRGKVEAFHNMEGAAHLAAELSFVRRAISVRVPLELLSVFRGDPYGPLRAGAIVSGIVLAGLGHVVGRLRLTQGKVLAASG